MQTRSFILGFVAALALAGSFAWAQARNFDETVLARVNDTELVRRHLVERLLRYHGQAGLETLINQTLTRQIAERHEVTVAPEEVDQRLNEVKRGFGNDWEAFLEESGITEERYREQIQYTMLAQKTALKIHPIRENDLEQLEVRVILCRDMAHARQVVQNLRGGARFESLVAQESQDQDSKVNGGLLPPMFRHDLMDVWDFASKLQPGQYTREPVPTSAGRAMIIRLERRIPYAQVSESERRRGQSLITSYRMHTLLEELRKNSKIEYVTSVDDVIRPPDTVPPAR